MSTPGKSPSGRIETSSYARTYGSKFSHGTHYKGHGHRHWSRKHYSKSYGCWCWYCPSVCCWYYWSAPAACYFPFSYAAIEVPTVGGEMPPGGESVPNEADQRPPD